MTEPALSQEEVEVLTAAGSHEEAAADPPEEANTSGVKSYDLAGVERIVRGRMPTLETVNELFAQRLRDAVSRFMQRDMVIEAGAVTTQKFGDLLDQIPQPANFNIMRARPLHGCGLIVCESQLIFAVVNAMFGGTVHQPVAIEGRDFSATEQRIIARLVEIICSEYAGSWAPIYPLQLEYTRSELHSRLISIAGPSDLVVNTTFNIGWSDAGGAIHICIPYAVLEPIREILYSRPRGDQTASIDTRWLVLLTQQIRSATVELSAEFAHSQATVRELMALKRGDFIEFDRAPTVTAKINGVPVFECDYGVLGAHYGLRVREIFSDPAQSDKSPSQRS